MKTEHHTLTKTWVVAKTGKFMLYSMGKCHSNDQDRISTVTSRYDKYGQSDRICRNKICVSRAFRLDFCFYTRKKVTLPDGKILKYAVPVCLAQTVGQYFSFILAWHIHLE